MCLTFLIKGVIPCGILCSFKYAPNYKAHFGFKLLKLKKYHPVKRYDIHSTYIVWLLVFKMYSNVHVHLRVLLDTHAQSFSPQPVICIVILCLLQSSQKKWCSACLERTRALYMAVKNSVDFLVW